MELKGSCHCEKVSFTVVSNTPVPFMRCYCSICRKCQGGGACASNIMGLYNTLKVQGEEYVKGYQAYKNKKNKEIGGNIRYFCGDCGSYLYAYDKAYKEFVYPFASAIDTDLPELDSEQIYRIMLDFKANWEEPPKSNHMFGEYPDCSIEEWHRKNNRYIE
ncbi:Mss4-like protein [Sporodiniella umbellata]|nr:Mss4-like protein [Sporodiniella umbellata]